MIELMDLTDKSISALTDIADLEDKGHRIVDVLGGDVTPALEGDRAALPAAIGKLRAARTPDGSSLPPWMHGVTEMTPGKALSTGFLIGAGNPKNVAMAIGASVVIGSAALPTVQIAIAVLVAAVLASLGVAAPLVVAIATGERSTAILTEARDWLERHNAVVLGIMYLVFAAVLVTKGVQAIP